MTSGMEFYAVSAGILRKRKIVEKILKENDSTQ